MTKTTKVIIVVCIVLFFLVRSLYSRITGTYNALVSMDEGVKESWAQVENQYQRRLDLIPNLVSTVKGYASHEKETLEAVVAARAKATQTKVDINDATSLAQFQQAQGELSSVLSRLLVVTENYPDLKANQNFLELQSQLEGTENRISVERKRYNEVVKTYNITIRQFPQRIIASWFGFQPAQLFAAEEGAAEAPDVSFEGKSSEGEAKVENLQNEIEATELEIELQKKKQELEAVKKTAGTGE